MTKTREMHQQIADWYRQRDADDTAKLAEIAERYDLRPAGNMDDLPGQMTDEDAATVREILSHRSPVEEARAIFGDMNLLENFTPPRRRHR